MKLLQAVANDHLHTLNQQLEQHNLKNLEQLHGFLTAVASSPNPPATDQWLQYAKAQSIESESDKEALVEAMKKVYQDIVDQLANESLDFLELEDEQERQNVLDEIKLWAQGYMDAVNLDKKTWLLDKAVDELLHPLHLITMSDDDLKNLMNKGGYGPEHNMIVTLDSLRDFSARMLSFNVYELNYYWIEKQHAQTDQWN